MDNFNLSPNIYLNDSFEISNNNNEWQKTDNKDYYIYSLEQLSQYWYQFKKISFDLHHEDIENYMTEFEKEYYKLKRPIYYVEAIYK